MMKTEPPSATGGNGTSGGSGSSNLRSPSPHRNAYEAGLAALKKATDHLNNAHGACDAASKPALLPRPSGRGQKYGSNVHRIKNMFMQMQSPGDEEDGAKTIGEICNRGGTTRPTLGGLLTSCATGFRQVKSRESSCRCRGPRASVRTWTTALC